MHSHHNLTFKQGSGSPNQTKEGRLQDAIYTLDVHSLRRASSFHVFIALVVLSATSNFDSVYSGLLLNIVAVCLCCRGQCHNLL